MSGYTTNQDYPGPSGFRFADYWSRIQTSASPLINNENWVTTRTGCPLCGRARCMNNAILGPLACRSRQFGQKKSQTALEVSDGMSA